MTAERVALGVLAWLLVSQDAADAALVAVAGAIIEHTTREDTP